MSTGFIRFVIFWGVWILVPIIVDGLTTLFGLIGHFNFHFRNRKPVPPLSFYPYISIIIPVYNGEKTLALCVESIARQSYPFERMEVVIINNGSTDHSFKVFTELQKQLKLRLGWHSIVGRGKSWALNTGIHLTSGKYVFGLDCDVVLDKNAVKRFVEQMEADPGIGAGTGYLVIMPPPSAESRIRLFLANFEFLEYATTFGVGRTYQSVNKAIYTLSGACTVYRREALLRTFLYNKSTVSEDTDMTFQLYEKAPRYRVVAVPQAKIYLHPIGSLFALYAQRVRWQRGQLEVSALHEKLMNKSILKVSGFSPARALLIDHTLSFPRFVWMFFMPILVFFGYSPSLIVTAYLLVYLFYLLSELLWLLAAYIYADVEIKCRIRQNWIYSLFMPLYRSLIFFFRFSGFLYALIEPATWSVQDPGKQIKEGLKTVRIWFQQKFHF
ncbi:MAG TPA: TIGR03111 family XrtG-associated glycosyltransferase [Anaerolineales bacterium]